MPEVELTVMEVRGQNFKITVTEGGWFSAKIGENTVQAETLTALRTKLLTATKTAATKVSVPFTMVVDGKVVQATATGVHGSTGNITIRIDKTRKAESLPSYCNYAFKRMTDAEVEELQGLLLAKEEAIRAVELFQRERKFNIGTHVRDLVAGLVKEMQDAAE